MIPSSLSSSRSGITPPLLSIGRSCAGVGITSILEHLPAGQNDQARVEPIYETIEGWEGSTANARSWADLPAQAIKYVRRIEELIGATVAVLSTSPERDDTILDHNPFEG